MAIEDTNHTSVDSSRLSYQGEKDSEGRYHGAGVLTCSVQVNRILGNLS